jgi:large subunit ribosomal protein L25
MCGEQVAESATRNEQKDKAAHCMAMELSAKTRTKLGRAVKALRKDGLIPAELYGHGIKNEHLEVSLKEFRKVLRHAGETSIIDLMVEGKKHPVFIHEVMRNPVTDVIVTADFYQVRLDRKIKIKVPLVFIGEAPGVKEKGGIFVRSLSELEVEGLPLDIPQNVEVNISNLADIGASIHVNELPVSDKVTVLVKPDFVVATITARMTEEQEAALAAKGADVTEVKSEADLKKAEKEAAAAAAAPEGAAAAPEAKK